jgi:hypothetical protein
MMAVRASRGEDKAFLAPIQGTPASRRHVSSASRKGMQNGDCKYRLALTRPVGLGQPNDLAA